MARLADMWLVHGTWSGPAVPALVIGDPAPARERVQGDAYTGPEGCDSGDIVVKW